MHLINDYSLNIIFNDVNEQGKYALELCLKEAL